MTDSADALFTHIYNEQSQRVFKYVYFKTYDRELAADLTQTVFLKIYEKVTLLDPDRAGSYCMTVVRNCLIDYWRAHHIDSSLDDDMYAGVASDPIDTELLSQEHVTIINAVLHLLEPDDAELVRLRALSDWSYVSIADQLGIPEATVRKRYSRALQKMHDIIRTNYPHYEFTS